LYEELNANILDSRGKGTQAAQKAQLSSLRASAELAYDKGNSYGGVVFPLGPCATTPNTLFADMAVAQAIRSATQNDMAKATCASVKSGVTVDTYAVSVPLSGVEGFSWCVDSAGRSMQIRGSITKAACM
jgi:hypothetical protein